MEAYYPGGPADVPQGLASPSQRYRRHAWVATAGLLFFILAYFGFAGWLAWTAWRVLSGLPNAGDEFLWSLIAGASAALLAIFMLKALFFVQRGQGSGDLEITAAEQPVLFDFLNRLADDVRAPRPHRVYVSGGVNAAVFYDLSIANLLIPSRKNLEIGLGLVNVLSLGELKAVLAHEFGHFAQRTMAVGRWVYVAQQIAGHIVARRDAFDRLLSTLSRIDLRIAWIGWLLQIIVWSIRSLIDMLFRLVVLAQRALSREMEFQADLVSVSVTGSDALIHALHRLAAADDAWHRTLAFAADEQRAGRPVKDLFAVQTRIIANLRNVLDDAHYGDAPAEAPGPETRVFKVAVAAPPRMWSTHPSNSDREENAKRTYVPAAIDARSAWCVFADPETLRERVSKQLVGKMDSVPVPTEQTLAQLDGQYQRSYLDRRYRGAYLGRSIVRHARELSELYGPEPSGAAATGFDALYPESLSDDIERLRELEQEKGLLEALRAGQLTAPGGVIKHRGREISRKGLPGVIEAVRREIEAAAERVRAHDRLCRTLHVSAARAAGPGWAEYLQGLLGLHHYADHVEANLRDAQALLINTVNLALADRKVSQSDMVNILGSADSVYRALKDVQDEANTLLPDATVLARIGKGSWRESLEELKLPPPARGNIGDWLNVVHGWIGTACASVGALRLASLEQLLAAEEQVASAARSGAVLADAPAASVIPRDYRLLTPGSERPKDKLGWWDRFMVAGGVVPATARVLAAAGIVGLVVWIGTSVGSASVRVYNGLGTAIRAQIGTQALSLGPYSHRDVNVGTAGRLAVRTTTRAGATLEEFEAALSGRGARDVYNVAGAGVLVTWIAEYGGNERPDPQVFGHPRWSNPRTDYVLEDPPRSVSSRTATTRSVLSAVAGGPARVLAPLQGRVKDQQEVIGLHARWDPSNAPHAGEWLAAAARLPDSREILSQRLKADPLDVLNLRFEQDLSTGAEHEAVCERHRALASGAPENPDLQYLAARCIADQAEQSRRFLELAERWPQHPWLALATAYVQAGTANWTAADARFREAVAGVPSLRDPLAVDAARVRRVVLDDAHAVPAELAAQSEQLQQLRRIETEGPAAGELGAYAALGRGGTGEALSLAAGAGTDRARLLRLVAASDGAASNDVTEALSLPAEQGLDDGTFLTSLALADKAGRDRGPLLARESTIAFRNPQQVMQAYELIRSHASPATIEAALEGLAPQERGHVYAAAVVLWGSHCPQPWRRLARELLFVPERPFFR